MKYQIKKTLIGTLVRYSCPRCGAGHSASLSDAGSKQVCEGCGNGYVVPGEAEKFEAESNKQAKKELAEIAKQEKAEEKKRRKLALAAERERLVAMQQEKDRQNELADQGRLAAQPVVVQPERPQVSWRCPYCQSSGGSYSEKHITSGGCMLAILLLLFCLPLCWLGLLFTDERAYCRSCRTRLS